MPDCPSCSSTHAVSLGQIPSSDRFAGRVLDQPIAGGELIRCKDCSLAFRWPRTPQSVLDRLYRDGFSHAWADEPGNRIDWTIAAGWLRQEVGLGSKILDIGCSTGGFFAGLPQRDIQKFGIEINPEAAKVAMHQGVQILASDIFEYAAQKAGQEAFSEIVAFDVVEHTQDPLEFLQVCADLVKPGGRIILGTGNSNARSWEFSGARYWYCAIAEHMSFIGDEWCQIAAKKLRLGIERLTYFSHGQRSIRQRVREGVSNFTYRISPGVFRKLRILGIGGKDVRCFPELADFPPSWMSAKDHILIEFRKIGAS